MQTIDHELRPTIIGEIKSRPTRIHEAMGSTGREHRRRLKVRDDLKAAGAKGAMDSVALAPIKLRGRDPVQVLDELLEQVSSVPRPAVPIHREGDLTEAVYFHESMVVASISLNGGHYSKGCLIIFGELPEILINTASGKPLYEIVDHSAFEMAKLKVVRATGRQAACDFEHQRKFGFVGLASS